MPIWECTDINLSLNIANFLINNTSIMMIYYIFRGQLEGAINIQLLTLNIWSELFMM